MSAGTTAAAPGYRALFTVEGFSALTGSALLSRTANRMWEVGIVLFVLERFHSAALAGLTVFLSVFPGILASPLAGALLDRHGRRRFIFLDNVIAAATLCTIALLALTGVLNEAMLLPIVTLSSLTLPLSVTGTRALFPVVVPRHFWDLANAVDSGSDALASIVGPALVGALVGWIGGARAILVSAAIFLAAAAAVLRVREPDLRLPPAQSLGRAALSGVGYVVRNASLRGLAVTMSVGNLAYGGLTVILPVLVLTRLRAGAGLVGALWALQGVATVVAGLTVGRLGSEGRERRLLALGFAVMSVALVLILLPGWTGVVVAMLLAGASVGAVDIAIFSLRQRRTDPAWFGRAISVSMALNFAGMPIGSGLAGPVVARSLTLALVLAAALSAASSVLCVALIPRRDPVRATTGTN